MEITFVVVVLYAIVKVVPGLKSSSGGPNASNDGSMGSIASRQLSSLMVDTRAHARTS
jgi:hypothetical protein